MSLVPTHCYCSDGLWYEDPVWRGYDEDGKLRWFLCLDDDDPPEMVLRVDDSPKDLDPKGRAALFPQLDYIRYTSNASSFDGQWRQFGNEMVRASSRWCELIKVPPPPTKSDGPGTKERRPGECVFYDLRRKHG